MDWNEFLRDSATNAYRATASLAERVDPKSLDWKPEGGSNWMTTGQLLRHLSDACGAVARGFVTGTWEFADGEFDSTLNSDGSPSDGDGMLPPAEKLPTIDSLDGFRTKLDEDRSLFFSMLETAGDRVETETLAAPWDPTPKLLAIQLHDCILHLESHKGQLFYYLKMQGESVNTHDLWGMKS